MRKPQQRARRYEKEQAKKHRGKAKGGPGQPDYTRGKVKAEVKNWQRPVHSGVVKKAKQNGVTEIVSSSRFTQPAIEEAKNAGITLILRGKRLT
ncbi:MAG: hypothetical protein DDT30_01728 [Dehalococcoidia bacterium]|nr:hypothetical protein [Bacillota bacterium]